MQHRHFSALWIRSYEDFIYINDELIASSSEEEHHQHVKQLFDGFKDSGVCVNPSKCQLGVPPLQFLGHIVNKDSISTEI